jgi:O-antigen ligase
VDLISYTPTTSELTLQTVGSIRIARTAGLGEVAGMALAAARRRWSWLVPVPLWILVMFASGNRASIPSLVAGTLPLLLGVRAARVVKGGLLLAAVAGLLLYLIPPATELTTYFFRQALWEADGRIYLADRGILFEKAWELFVASPLVGYGLGGYSVEAGLYYDYPHNLTLNFASELGLLGLVPYSLLLGMVVVAFLRNRPSQSATLVGMSGVLAYLFVAAQFAGTFGDAYLMWAAALAVYAGSAPQSGSVTARQAVAP